MKVPSKSSTSSKFLINSKENGKKFPSSPSSRVKKLPRTPNRVPGSKGELNIFVVEIFVVNCDFILFYDVQHQHRWHIVQN